MSKIGLAKNGLIKRAFAMLWTKNFDTARRLPPVSHRIADLLREEFSRFLNFNNHVLCISRRGYVRGGRCGGALLGVGSWMLLGPVPIVLRKRGLAERQRDQATDYSTGRH